MKKLISLLLLQSFFSFIFGQTEIREIQIRENLFLNISLETLINMFNQPYSEWIELMEEKDYQILDDSTGNYIFIKGEIGEQTHTISKLNEGRMLIIVWMDFLDNKRMINELKTALQPYYTVTRNMISYFVYQEYNIGIKCIYDDDLVDETVYIKKL